MAAGGEAVLFIEDHEDVAVACTAMLESCGFEVLHVETAEAGLAAFHTRPFDLILSDICLPGGMDGVELAITIRQQRPDMRIILATGYSHRADDAEKHFVVLRKPFGMDQFRAAIDRVMHERTPNG